jgi:hypothetical protein
MLQLPIDGHHSHHVTSYAYYMYTGVIVSSDVKVLRKLGKSLVDPQSYAHFRR